MGLDYSAYLDVGFILPYEETMEHFVFEVSPAVYKFEDRFDPITGQKTAPVQVLEQHSKQEFRIGERRFAIDEEPIDDEQKFFEILGQEIGAEISRMDNDDLGTQLLFSVPPQELKWVGNIVECGRVTFGSHLCYETVVKAAPRLEQIRKNLMALGLKPGRPLVIHNTSIY